MQKPRSPYFVSLPVDALFIGGFSIVMYLVFLALHFGETRTTPIILTALIMAWFINWPHFTATSWRLYRSAASRNQFPVTAYVVPVVVIGLTAAALLQPEAIGSWWVKLFLIWSPYHFSAQTLGITMLYARRHNFIITPMTRRFLSCFIFSTFLVPSLRGEAGDRSVRYAHELYYGIHVPVFGLPAWVAEAVYIAMFAAGAIAIVMLVRAAWRSRVILPLMVVLPAVTQFVWFGPGSNIAGYNEFVSAFHAVQYLFIAWIMQLRERMEDRRQPHHPRYVLSETSWWAVCNMLLGAALFAALPWAVSALTGQELMVTTGLILVGLQIHHFFVDGVIWKLRNAKVHAPLMTNLDDIRQGRAAPA